MTDSHQAELAAFTRMAVFIARHGDDQDEVKEEMAWHACLHRFADEINMNREEVRRQAAAIAATTATWDLDTGARQFLKDAQELMNMHRGSSRLSRLHEELQTLAHADSDVSAVEQFMLDEVQKVWELEAVVA